MPMLYFILIGCIFLCLPSFAVDYPADFSGFPVDKVSFPAQLENMRPGQIRDAVRQGAVALLPVGAMVSTASDAPLGASEAVLQQALSKLASENNTVIAPTIWYTPTGYLTGSATDGTFDMPTMTFVRYVREVLLELRAIGFKRVELVVLDKGQGEQSLLYAACKYILGDYMNNYWNAPETGKGWWSNPATKAMSWETTGIRMTTLPPEPSAPKTVKLSLPLRLEQMRPSELREAIRQGLPCFVPAGVIENHGNHNPVGVDGIEAEDPLVDAAKTTPVVVAPTLWYAGTAYAVTGPQLGTMNISGDSFYDFTLGVTVGLTAMGFKHVTFIHDHQGGGAQDTGIALVVQEYKRLAAMKAIPQPNAVIEHFGTPGGQFDHAGKNETSWIMYYRPSLVDLSLIRPNDFMFCWYKGDEANTASHAWGKQMADQAVKNFAILIKARTISPAAHTH